jgi:uncharacterized protein (TIGR03083 family)
MTATLEAAPRRPALDRPTAMRLAADEYQRFLDQLRELGATQWSAPTQCPGWDVRAMVAHVLAMAEGSASMRENVRQLRAAKRRMGSGPFIDALTAVQVEKYADAQPAELLSRFADIAPKAARGRRRTPAPLRSTKMPIPQTFGGITEEWQLGYLVDVILTRDTWMHRADIAAATGRELTLTADHDGTLVADVATEWLGRHGQPCTLRLTGAAGGEWTQGGGRDGEAPVIEMDAVDFCRLLSGRGVGAGLLAVQVPF